MLKILFSIRKLSILKLSPFIHSKLKKMPKHLPWEFEKEFENEKVLIYIFYNLDMDCP